MPIAGKDLALFCWPSPACPTRNSSPARRTFRWAGGWCSEFDRFGLFSHDGSSAAGRQDMARLLAEIRSTAYAASSD